jgi:hypothetical protein
MSETEGIEYATCGACRGTGNVDDEVCPRCGGKGQVALPLPPKRVEVRKATSVSMRHLPRGESDSVARSCLNLGCGLVGVALALVVVLLGVLGYL